MLHRRLFAVASFMFAGAGLFLVVATVPFLQRALLVDPRRRRALCSNSKRSEKSTEPKDDEGEEEQFGILLFYEYAALSDVPAVIRELEALCRRLGLCGRLRVSEEGFNGNLSGPWTACKQFVADVQHGFGELSGTDFKLAPCTLQQLFRGLKVWESDEVCGLFAAQEGVDRTSAAQGLAEADRGKHLSPEAWHEMMSSADAADVVLFDVRNRYETRIGCFARNTEPHGGSSGPLQLVDPNTRFFHEVPNYLTDAENLTHFRGKKVMMYCTGGVRCERASALLKQQLGDEAEVYQLAGGIQRYLETHPDGGFFQGSMHVFDRRGRVSAPDCAAPGTFTDKQPTSVIGRCVVCTSPWDRYQGKWRCEACGLLVLICARCQGSCSKSRRTKLRCELCDPSITTAATEMAAVSKKEEQRLSKNSPAPPRLLTFTDRAENIVRLYDSDTASTDTREMLKWLNSRRLRETISGNTRTLKVIRALFDEAQRHEDVSVAMACSQAVEHLLRDLPARASICRATQPVDMALALLERSDAAKDRAAEVSVKVGLQILWRVAEVSEARAALVGEVKRLQSALLKVFRLHSNNVSVQREAFLAIRAFAEQSDLRRIVADAGIKSEVISAAEFAALGAKVSKHQTAGSALEGVLDSGVDRTRADAEFTSIALAAVQTLQTASGCNGSSSEQARVMTIAKSALRKHGKSSSPVKKWATMLIKSNYDVQDKAEDAAMPRPCIPPSPLPRLQLKDVVDVALLRLETAARVRTLWLEQFKSNTRVLAGVVAAPEYQGLRTAATTCPTFLAPVMRGTGVVNLVWQSQGDRFLYQSLEAFHGGAAGAGAGRADLVVTLFPDFLESHGLVLLHGQLCSDLLTKHEAAGVVRFTRQAYSEPLWFAWVKVFNLESNKFDFNSFLTKFVESGSRS